MKEITLYCSDNENFVFENKEECLHYDNFGIVTFDQPFLKLRDESSRVQVVLLECTIDVKKSTMVAYLQILEASFCETMANNHDMLWKVTYDLNQNRVSFEYKDGTHDRVYSDMNFTSANQTGWYPFWKRLHIETDVTIDFIAFTEEKFLEHIKQVIKGYYVGMEYDIK